MMEIKENELLILRRLKKEAMKLENLFVIF
jgi:hypothetical protein